MFNLIPSYDSNGALIERLYQWDLNQTITVKHLDFENAPVFHFCNRKSKESLAVQSQATGNGYTANVPNILLQQALKITAFIYYEGDGIGRTVFRTEIPVEPKPKPTDYLYDDNIADVLKKGSALLNEIDEKIENAVSNADKAAAKADTAAKAANAAAQKAEKVNISAEQTPTGANVTVTDRNGEQTTVHIDTLVAIDSWEDIKNAVRLGLGEKLFPIGTQLKCKKEGAGEIVWDVVAHDYNVDPIGRYKHSMTLLTHDCVVNSLQYDNVEALYYCETPLVAGTYRFTLLDGYDTANGGGKTYQFTLTKPVPANGVIMFPWAYNTQASTTKVSTYNSVTETTAIETVGVTEGSGGIELGTADGNTENMNHTHRIRYSSSNWKESAMRQFLNSAAPAGQVWKSQTKFDRPPSWNKTQAGWMNGLDPEFLAVVGTAKITNRTNNLYEEERNTNQNYYTEDKFWLASRSEVYGGSESSLSDGTQFPYYAKKTDAEKIKYNTSGAARHWWLRSPYTNSNVDVRLVGTDGLLNYSHANNSYGVAAACVIF